MLREALASLDIAVLGTLRRDDSVSWRDRHLGLVPVVEQRQEVGHSLDQLGAAVAASCDLDAAMRLAASAPERHVTGLPEPRVSGRARVAVASGPAFSFVYPDNLEALEQAGAELAAFDPLADVVLPDGCSALYAGGGFPEVVAEALAANRPLLDDVRQKVAGGLVTWAECGGLLWLSRSLDGQPLAGVIDVDARMTDRLTLGYRRARVCHDNPVAQVDAELRGHEFHYSVTDPSGEALALRSRFRSHLSGFASPTLLATYLHLHLGATPAIAERFVAAAC